MSFKTCKEIHRILIIVLIIIADVHCTVHVYIDLTVAYVIISVFSFFCSDNTKHFYHHSRTFHLITDLDDLTEYSGSSHQLSTTDHRNL